MAPRLSTARGKRTPEPQARTGPAPIGDNSMHGEEAERVQMISFIGQRAAARKEVEVARAPFDAAKKKYSSINNLAKAAGFTVKELDAREAEMGRSDSENATQFACENRHRRWLGTTSEEQQRMRLDDATPQEAMDELDWQSRGYRDGLRNLEAKPPEGCPPRMDQPYLKGHETGRAEFVAALAANVPKAPANVRQQAAADFAEDNKPEPGTPEAAAAERKAVRKAKESLEKLGERAPDAGAADPDAPFEATAEELAAQTPRQAVQNARDGDAEEVV